MGRRARPYLQHLFQASRHCLAMAQARLRCTPPHAPHLSVSSLAITRARLAAAAAPLPPRCLAPCTPPACCTRCAHAASLVHRAGSRSARLWGMAKVLAAADTSSSSCTRLTMFCFPLLRAVVVVCARACAIVPRLQTKKVCTFRGGVRTHLGVRLCS